MMRGPEMPQRSAAAQASACTAPPGKPDSKIVRVGIARSAVRFAAALLAALLSAMPAQAELPRLYTNEAMVEDVTRKSTLAIDDLLAVFSFVLNSLPARVTVYPTENYYYFWFYHNGNRYAGNIRIDVLDRDKGKVHFAYFKDFTEWSGEPDMKYMLLDGSHGVTVEKLETLLYRVTFRGRSVTFALNDLSKVAPPASVMGPDEKYLGPVFDESAIRLFLLYNTRLKVFHYILDETVPVPDELLPAQSTDRILIGRRTGFAYYRDHRLDRKILIGVFEGNSRSNNYYDGPFDQLPDNFIHDESLRNAILEVEPDLKGKIDRYGIAPDAASRYMIGPYLHYRSEEDLDLFHECATSKRIPADQYYNCFVIDDVAEAPPPPPPQKARPRPAKAKKK
ncbi:MAG: hypothetical protein IT536_10350 [Hyphomicrobiales bacterium]|nr:hypothetical protein [Hyphomicrobiales bacterium]